MKDPLIGHPKRKDTRTIGVLIVQFDAQSIQVSPPIPPQQQQQAKGKRTEQQPPLVQFSLVVREEETEVVEESARPIGEEEEVNQPMPSPPREIKITKQRYTKEPAQTQQHTTRVESFSSHCWRNPPPYLVSNNILLWLLEKTFLSSSVFYTIENGQTENWVASKSETITVNGTEQEQEEEDQLHQSLSLPIFTNLTHDEMIQMKSYCTQHYEIGEGSFGRVYLGMLKDKDVAIKKIKRAGRDSKKFIENEVRLLQGKEHKNLVSLIAWCIEENTFYLVYEYVDGCTLDEYLRGSYAQFSLNWNQCLRIISSRAEGIEFLHRNKIIHLDIKPQNLMVDSKDNEVKIIDFGLSRHVDWEGTHRSADRIAGSRGYWAPEYCLSHKLSYKHDVYSFGIVVLEVITGQKHVDNARGSSQFHIPDYVRYMMTCNRLEEALDERFKVEGFDECDLRDALAVAKLALKCAEPNKKERPDMSYVVRLLNNMRNENTEGNSSEVGD
ncbi:hypothetical protein SUGI_0859590 [Cryptomeria japonica]|nr:hypothetical protein SUGI_0859590 [Cryptomeria japonica]